MRISDCGMRIENKNVSLFFFIIPQSEIRIPQLTVCTK